MKIETALILSAGLGKRLNPLTLKKPKPLLELNNLTLLENTINLIKDLGLKRILINTFHLKDQIKNYINSKNFQIKIEIIEDGPKILDTGGGIKNMIKKSKDENFLIFNPDTVWNKNYVKPIVEMNNFFEKSKIQNILLVVNKKFSFDTNLKGDFNLEENLLSKNKNCDYIYVGCQILSKNLIINYKKQIFSFNEIWNDLVKTKNLYGFNSMIEFYHVTNLEIYNKLLKHY